MGCEGVMNSDGTRGSYANFFKKVVTEVVLPAKATEHAEVVIPSHLDYLHMDRYVPLLLMYRLGDNADDSTYRRFVHQVKSALAETLGTFYPMAGRVVKSADPDHPRHVVCNDRGVPFTEAFIDAEMDSVVNIRDFKPIAYLSGFEPAGLNALKQLQEYREDGIPAAFVQVTRFNCGGVILASSWNHMITDMTGAMHFLTAWSDISRMGSTSIVPDHDRSVLCKQEESSDSSPAAAPPVISAAEAAKIQEILKAKFEMKTLHVSRAAVSELKRQAVQDHPEVSTMDCLCAHLWRSLSRVYAAAGVTDVTAFTTAVEGRSKMGVSPTYFGNVITSAPVMGVPAADILSKPLSYAASLIRKAVKGIQKDTYWSIINEMDLRNPWKSGINRTDYQLGLTSWARFGVNDLDFGFGRPAYVIVNLPAQNSRKGQCIVVPSAAVEGDYFVVFFLAPHILKALWAEPDFTSIS